MGWAYASTPPSLVRTLPPRLKHTAGNPISQQRLKSVPFIIFDRTRVAFARRIPGLKGETWATLRVSSLHGWGGVLDWPLLGGSQVSKARPGAPFACPVGVFRQAVQNVREWFLKRRPVHWTGIPVRCYVSNGVRRRQSPTPKTIPAGRAGGI